MGYFFTNRVNLGKMIFWDPWIGCTKISEACEHCFYCPKFNGFSVGGTRKDIPEGLSRGTIILTAFRSDFFIDFADAYRDAAWKAIKEHPEYIFVICTKRVQRIEACLPEDWKDGYDNVVIAVTAENQRRVDERLPIFLKIPCKHKWIAAMPLLEPIDVEAYLEQGIEHVEVGGESAPAQQVRQLNYDWVVNLADQCQRTNTRMSFMTVGNLFVMNDEIFTHCDSACYHSRKADSLKLDVPIPLNFMLAGKEFIIK